MACGWSQVAKGRVEAGAWKLDPPAAPLPSAWQPESPALTRLSQWFGSVAGHHCGGSLCLPLERACVCTCVVCAHVCICMCTHVACALVCGMSVHVCACV